MCVGEKRRVLVPPSWGYGERGSDSGKVPGSAVIIFDVHLIDFHNPSDVPVLTPVGNPPEDCVKPVETQILRIDYHAMLEDGTSIDEFHDLKIQFNNRKLVYGLYTLLGVSIQYVAL